MRLVKQHQTDKKILEYISGHIDRLMKANPLPMEGREVIDFDKVVCMRPCPTKFVGTDGAAFGQSANGHAPSLCHY